MSQINYMILQALKNHLANNVNAGVLTTDPTYVDVVKFGRFQDNPVQASKNVSLSISGGSQADPDLEDGVLNIEGHERIGFYMPSREIGGGSMWWRRGEVKINIFYIQNRLPEEQAADAAYTVLGRVTNLIESTPCAGMVDDFSERAVKFFAYASTFFESGGPPTQYIWRGSVKFQVLTERT